MAGSQFVTPKRTLPSRPNRFFTLAQANRALPLVNRVVTDIVKSHERIASMQAALAGKDQSAAHTDMDRAVEVLQGYVDELHEVGCDLKDYQIGLVDFPAHHQGREVSLCWRLGEEQIGYWHENNAGYAGRQPVSTLQE